jgi:hypothetical protein
VRDAEPVGAHGIDGCAASAAEYGNRHIAQVDGLIDDASGRVVLAEKVTLFAIDILIRPTIRHVAPCFADALAEAVNGVAGGNADGDGRDHAVSGVVVVGNGTVHDLVTGGVVSFGLGGEAAERGQAVAGRGVVVGRGAGARDRVAAVAVGIVAVGCRGGAVEEAGEPVVVVLAISLGAEACLREVCDAAGIVVGEGLHIDRAAKGDVVDAPVLIKGSGVGRSVRLRPALGRTEGEVGDAAGPGGKRAYTSRRVITIGDGLARGVFEGAETAKGIVGVGHGERHSPNHLRLCQHLAELVVGEARGAGRIDQLGQMPDTVGAGIIGVGNGFAAGPGDFEGPVEGVIGISTRLGSGIRRGEQVAGGVKGARGDAGVGAPHAGLVG